MERWLPGARGGRGGELVFNETVSAGEGEGSLETDGGDCCTEM